jgi:hypothetical protein
VPLLINAACSKADISVYGMPSLEYNSLGFGSGGCNTSGASVHQGYVHMSVGVPQAVKLPSMVSLLFRICVWALELNSLGPGIYSYLKNNDMLNIHIHV